MFCLDLDNLSTKEHDLLNAIAKEIRHEYLNVTNSINIENCKNEWLFSSIFSRNPHISDMHLRLSQIALIQEVLKTRKVDSIKTKDFILGKFLKKKYGSSIRILDMSSFYGKIKIWAKPWIDCFKGIFYLSSRILGRNKSALKNLPKKPITLIETFVFNSQGEGGFIGNKFKERYYPGLMDVLTKEEKENIYLFPTFINFRNFSRGFKKARKSGTRFIIPDDFLHLEDYFKIFRSCFLLRGKKIKPIFFRNTDISPLLREENRRNAFHFSSILAHLHYYFTKRLVENKISLRFFLSWYENQPQNRGSIGGLREFFHETQICGYQGFIASSVYNFNICPTLFEYNNKLTPHTLALTGKALIEGITEFCKDIPIKIVPAFRSQKLFDIGDCQNRNGLLVILPIRIDNALDILKAVFQLQTKDQIIIKGHPSFDVNLFKKKLLFPKNATIASTSVYELFEKAGIVITNGSSTALEASLLGKSVIIYDSSSKIRQTAFTEKFTFARNLEELKAAIDKLEKVKKKSADALEDYFMPMDKERARSVLSL